MGGIKSNECLKQSFIKKCVEKFGDKYDYSKVEYEGYKDKVIIICPEHSEFEITPHTFLRNKYGCPQCAIKGMSDSLSLDTETFKKRANEIHNYKYDYSKVEYNRGNDKVCIICPEHGEFWQRANTHLRGKGCKKCGLDELRLTTEEFIEKANKKHLNKYDYSKVEYKSIESKVCIICPEHGEFWQSPSKHLYGRGCPECGRLRTRNANLSNTKEFIEKAKKVHLGKYDYSKVIYRSATYNKVCIICPEHGEFWQLPVNHLHGDRCPKCNISKLEEKIENKLKENNINYIWQASKKDLNWLGTQSLDFYLPEYNIAIECQGEQHFKPVSWFGGEEQYLKQVKNDKRKYINCIKNNVRVLYYIPDFSILKDNDCIIYKNNNIFDDEKLLQENLCFFTK